MAKTELGDVHQYCISRSTRELWLHGSDIMLTPDYDSEEPGIEYMMSNKVCKNLLILRNDSATKPVTIHLHTSGGDWSEGMAIYDTVRLMSYPVKIINYTHARSMSSLIFLAGDERLMMPNSYFMFHMGTLGMEGTVKQVKSLSRLCDKCDESMIEIYVDVLKANGKYSKRSRSAIRSILIDAMDQNEEVYLSAQEAVEWGFADDVVESL